MPEEQRTEHGEVDAGFWKRTVKEAFKNDPLRIIIELVKNAADSYTRLEKKKKIKPPYEIYVKIFPKKGGPPSIEVIDNAEGMDSEKLKDALKYGTQTSKGEDAEATTSAEKGIGLKDATMSLRDNWIITIKDGLINERCKHSDFETGIGKENEKVTKKERDILGIQNNGTLVKGQLPEYFNDKKFETICEHLRKHFLMRKLLQIPDYKIYVINDWDKESVLLKYKPPEIDKQLLKDKFSIEHEGKFYPIEVTINKSKELLEQIKPYGDSGLIFFYGKYSVIDFGFCKYDKDISFSKVFGEVRMEVEDLIRNYEESPLVDEKRKGLDPYHPFNIKLIEEITGRLKKIREEEEASKYSLDDVTKREILQELNKLYKEIKGKGLPPTPRMTTQFFEFIPPWTEIKEYEPKKHFLVINPSMFGDKLDINLSSNNSEIIVKPNTIRIEKNKDKEEVIIKQIELYSEEEGSKGEIIAVSENPKYSSKMGVLVLENPIFSPDKGFAFVPDKVTILDGGEKKVDLCVDKNVSLGKEILLTCQDPINCPGKWTIPSTKNLEKITIKNILKEEIPIKVKGRGHIGTRATITASCGDKIAKLDITVVPEPSITGLFRDIRPSARETKNISNFVEEEGILEVYYKHPLIKKYMRKNFKNKQEFLVFIADTLTREAISAIVRSGVRESSSKFLLLNPEDPEPEIENYIIREYYDTGPKMHDMFIKLARKFEMGD